MFIIKEGQETPGFWYAFDWKEKSDIENKAYQPENWVRVNNINEFEFLESSIILSSFDTVGIYLTYYLGIHFKTQNKLIYYNKVYFNQFFFLGRYRD